MGQGKFDQFLQPEKPSSSKSGWLLYGGIAAAVILVLIIAFAFWPDRSKTDSTPEATLQGEVATTLEAEPSITETHTATPSPIPTDTATVTLTPTMTPTNSPSPTAAPSATPTLTATPATTATTATLNLITTICICEFGNAALYKEPDSNSEQVGVFVEAGDTVIVFGRAQTGSWIYVEYEGEKGWVDARRFDIMDNFEQLEIALTPFPTWTPTPSSPGTTSSTNTPVVSNNLSTIVYWHDVSKSSAGNGQWKVTLVVRVPRGGNYTFAIADLTVTKQFMGAVENGYDRYDVTISDMNCGDALIGDLIVKRNGQQLEVRNEFTNQSGPIFVSAPEC